MKKLFCLFACLCSLSLQVPVKGVASEIRDQYKKLNVSNPEKCFRPIEDDCPTPPIKPSQYSQEFDCIAPSPKKVETTSADDDSDGE